MVRAQVLLQTTGKQLESGLFSELPNTHPSYRQTQSQTLLINASKMDH